MRRDYTIDCGRPNTFKTCRAAQPTQRPLIGQHIYIYIVAPISNLSTKQCHECVHFVHEYEYVKKGFILVYI